VNTAYLLLGSNQGDRQTTIHRAVALLNHEAGTVQQCSKLYETAAWGNTDQPGFLNQAIQLLTTRNPYSLLECIQKIEHSMGRLRIEKWGQRTLDIDILLFNDLVLHSASLLIPHPELPGRRFALQPLCEIAPSFLHPESGLSISHLWEICPDPLPVDLYTDPA
jgi:2-amino-4-hydroxy-6-hydroxymethyldihydropteridine diphosphokinase